MPRLTISIDEDLAAKARAYAQSHQTTLNQVIREYLRTLTCQSDSELAADEFASLARERPGRSKKRFVFNRRAAHRRGKGDWR